MEDEGLDFRDAARARLGALVPGAGIGLAYEYDFGDSWQVEIRVVDVRPPLEDEAHPVCLDGARSGPPEDAGGVPGYMDLVDAFANPARKSSRELLEWAGPSFDPDRFDIGGVDMRVQRSRL